jgi:UDP-N-acetyl-D-galactosamine dehydrogenase
VPDIVKELSEYGIKAMVHDPLVDREEARMQYGIELVTEDNLTEVDLIVLAVPHKTYLSDYIVNLLHRMPKGCILMDIKSVLDPAQVSKDYVYWSL